MLLKNWVAGGGLVLALSAPVKAQVINPTKIIDLTYRFDTLTIYWPGEDRFEHQYEKYGKTPKGYFYSSARFAAPEHGGTHMDAPHHFIREGETIEHIPMNRMVGPAVVCDLSEIEGDQIEGTDLCRAIDRMEQKVRPGGFILLKTRSKEGPGKGLSLSAAEHLVHIGVSLVGTDSGGIDIGRNRNRPGHMTLLRNKVLIVESLTNLDRLLGQEFLFVAAPLAIEGGTGSPVRPIAICPYIEAQWPVLA